MTVSSLVEPAFCAIPPYVETLGPEVAGICDLAGFTPDPEQRLALDAIFALNQAREPAADEAAIVAPRQNIKTGLFKQCTLGWLFVTDQRLVIWSAHEFSTSQEAHRDLTELIEGSDWLRKRVKKITNANGDEGIELLTGQRVKFKARTKTGGRGLTGDKVVLDEAFALTDTQMGSLVPTMAARPHGQIIYGSSAGLEASEVLRGIRNRGRLGTDPGLVYLEWCDDLPGTCETDGCDHALGVRGCRLDDPQRWGRANTQMDRRILRKAIERERRSLPPREFARERLGWWDEPEGVVGAAIDLDLWGTLADPGAERGSSPIFGVATAPDRSWSAIAAAWRRDDGRTQVMLIDYRAGATWVSARAKELRERWGGQVFVDVASRGLVEDAEQPSIGDQGQAHNALADAVMGDETRHGNESALNLSVAHARWKPQGDSRVLDRKGGVDISPLAAAALAFWGVKTFTADVAGAVW